MAGLQLVLLVSLGAQMYDPCMHMYRRAISLAFVLPDSEEHPLQVHLQFLVSLITARVMLDCLGLLGPLK
jgi:hypothetical protein